jgi:hypothetical protein
MSGSAVVAGVVMAALFCSLALTPAALILAHVRIKRSRRRGAYFLIALGTLPNLGWVLLECWLFKSGFPYSQSGLYLFLVPLPIGLVIYGAFLLVRHRLNAY